MRCEKSGAGKPRPRVARAASEAARHSSNPLTHGAGAPSRGDVRVVAMSTTGARTATGAAARSDALSWWIPAHDAAVTVHGPPVSALGAALESPAADRAGGVVLPPVCTGASAWFALLAASEATAGVDATRGGAAAAATSDRTGCGAGAGAHAGFGSDPVTERESCSCSKTRATVRLEATVLVGAGAATLAVGAEAAGPLATLGAVGRNGDALSSRIHWRSISYSGFGGWRPAASRKPTTVSKPSVLKIRALKHDSASNATRMSLSGSGK